MSGPDGSSTFSLDLSREEVALYNNVLNEILNGIDVRDLEGQFGTSREAAKRLLRRFDEAHKTSAGTEKKTISLRVEDVRILRVGFLICIREFGEEEMSTRTGSSVPEAKRHVLALDYLSRDADR